jgi:hypothetical protein
VEAIRHLQLVVDGNGEIQSSSEQCQSCEVKDQTIERLTRSYEGTIRSLREQLDEKRREAEELDPVIHEVVEHWCRQAFASGLWTQMPTPTGPRCDATRVALNKGCTPGYLRMVNSGAFMAAVARGRNDKPIPRMWLEPGCIYRDAGGKAPGREHHYMYAADPKNERLRRFIDLPVALRERWVEVVEQGDLCDCGHMRFDHHKQGDGTWTCGVHGCDDCTDFSDFYSYDARVSAEIERLRRQR